MRGYGLMARDVPLTQLDEFDALLDSDESESETRPEAERAELTDVRRFIDSYGGGEVTLVG